MTQITGTSSVGVQEILPFTKVKDTEIVVARSPGYLGDLSADGFLYVLREDSRFAYAKPCYLAIPYNSNGALIFLPTYFQVGFDKWAIYIRWNESGIPWYVQYSEG